MDVDVMPRHGFEVIGGPWAGAIHCSLTSTLTGAHRWQLMKRGGGARVRVPRAVRGHQQGGR
jgi:hypothetical protein